MIFSKLQQINVPENNFFRDDEFDTGYDNMEHEISLSDSGRHVRIRMLKPITRMLSQQCGQDVADMANQLTKGELHGFLFDVRGVQNVSGVISNYMTVHKDLARFPIFRSVRSAILVDPADNTHDFLETVGRNAGYGFRIFRKDREAIAWLEKSTER